MGLNPPARAFAGGIHRFKLAPRIPVALSLKKRDSADNQRSPMRGEERPAMCNARPAAVRTSCGTGAAMLAGAITVFLIDILSGSASAQAQENAGTDIVLGLLPLADRIDVRDVLVLCIIFGTVFFAVFTGVSFLRARAALSMLEGKAASETGDLRLRLEKAEEILGVDNAAVIVWDDIGRPDMAGKMTGVAAGPQEIAKLLDFPSWLDADSSGRIATAIRALRSQGEHFDTVLTAKDGREIAAEGRATSGRTIVRFQPVPGHRAALAALEERCADIARDAGDLKQLINALPFPAWLRDREGRLAWANTSYADAVGAADSKKAVADDAKLLPATIETDMAFALKEKGRFDSALSTDGDGAMAETSGGISVSARAVADGSVGYALDMISGEAFKSALEKQTAAHSAMLDKLNAGIAMFGADRRLRFANSAFYALWGIDVDLVPRGCEQGHFLDLMRERRLIPEVVDYRKWKAEQLAYYDSAKPPQQPWYLPDGRTIRVVTEPAPSGGLVCLFEDQTEKIALQSRYNALMRVQQETLENMTEGVVVFGSDGRLKLHNPAFVSLWGLEGRMVGEMPHIEDVSGWCAETTVNSNQWTVLLHHVTDVADSREEETGRLSKTSGETIEYAVMPLPDGATLMTFTNITGAVNIEKALRERNEALIEADRLKDDFIQHVSYELRTPLTSVIGFAELMSNQASGGLNAKQADYVEAILSSSQSLLSVVDNILDLASIDAGTLSLTFEEVDLRTLSETTLDALKERIAEAGVKVELEMDDGIASLRADPQRMRQILFNLLSNAIGFSEPGASITLAYRDERDYVALSVIDEARGIPPEDVSAIFDRFMTRTHGTRHRGAGLGLSLVKSLVELHGGSVDVESRVGEGTKVTCRFPIIHDAGSEAAE